MAMSAIAPATTPPAAVAFFGVVTGKVQSRTEDGTSFQIRVTQAAPDENSKVKDPAAMIGLILNLGTRMPRDKEGIRGVKLDHIEVNADFKRQLRRLRQKTKDKGLAMRCQIVLL